jgi:hypothetical protein
MILKKVWFVNGGSENKGRRAQVGGF